MNLSTNGADFLKITFLRFEGVNEDANRVLVLHGCKDKTDKLTYYSTVVNELIKNKSLELDETGCKLLIYHHGNLKKYKELKESVENIKSLFSEYKLSDKIDPKEYGGGGLLACVYGLQRRLKENKDHICDEFARKILQMAKGSAFILFLLHHFRQSLLGIYFSLSAIIDDPEKNKSLLDISHQFKKTINDILKETRLVKYLESCLSTNNSEKETHISEEDFSHIRLWGARDDFAAKRPLPDSRVAGSILNLLFGNLNLKSIPSEKEFKNSRLRELQAEIKKHSQSLDRIIFTVSSGIGDGIKKTGGITSGQL